MIKLAVRIAALLTVCCVGFAGTGDVSAATAAKAKAKMTTEKVGSWQYFCIVTDKAKACNIKQSGSRAGTKKTSLVWTLHYDKSKALLSTVHVPTGVDLKSGLSVKWPSGTVESFSYVSCNANAGCVARTSVPKELLTGKPSKGKVAFTFFSTGKKPYTVTLSMDGFQKGMAKLKP